MHFLTPQMLWWLPLALLGAWIAVTAWGRQRQSIRAWGSRDNVPRYARMIPASSFLLKGCLLTTAIAAAMLALARPSVSNVRIEYPSGSVDVVSIIDVSRSMAARDCDGMSRLTVSRSILREEILPSVKSNRIGIVTYSGQAAEQAYLTNQIDVIDWLAENEMGISSAPGQGSAMGDAFSKAFKFFDKDSDESRKKVIVLFSDGGTDENTSLEDIGAGCRKRGITLIVAATGTTAPAMIPVEELSAYDRMTATDRFYKIGGKPAQTALEEKTLTALADICEPNSIYVPVTKREDFKLAPLTSSLKPQTKIGEKELYFYPAAVFFIGLCLASLASFIPRPKNR